MKEIRLISGTSVRQACINHEWFTCGDIEEYTKLFECIFDISNSGRNVTTSLLEVIARNIKNIATQIIILLKLCMC